MATTVRDLVDQLKKLDPDQTIVYQYLLSEHTDLGIDSFELRAQALENSGFADSMSMSMISWLEDMDVLDT
jgi:hypothetical protein